MPAAADRSDQRRTGLAVTLLLALAGCSYSYQNPVEALGPGEVGGRTVAGATLVIDGVAVSVKGAALDGLSRSNGHFSMLPLPVGHHTLMFRKGQERALQREVDIGYGQDGQVQGIWLGDVSVPAAVGLTGSCAPPEGHRLAENGVAVDEVSGAVVPVSSGSPGSFSFEGLAIGQHRLRVYATDEAGLEYVGGPATVDFLATDAGTRKTLARIPMHPASKAPSVPATVRITLAVSGSLSGLKLSALAITGLPSSPTIGSDGSAQVEVPEGLWTIGVTLPTSVPNVTAPPPVTFVALAGMTIDLGTLYAVTDSAQNQAASSCRSDADCAPGTCTASHLCDANYRPQQQAPASLPFCDHGWRGCAADQPLGGVWNNATSSYDPPITLTCVQAGAVTVGVVCGSCCTPDGVNTACAPLDSGGCAMTAVPPSFAISGTVSGAVAAGVQIWILGPGADTSTTTDTSGAYVFTGLANGTYTLTPSLPGYTFVPASLDVVVAGADMPLQDFTAVPAFHAISGTVSGVVVAGVNITLSGAASMATTTDSTGAYAFFNLLDGFYTVTPSLGVYSFELPSFPVTLSGADSGGWDFTSRYGWIYLPTVTSSTLFAVSGASSSNVWAVGGQGTVIHFNGVNWVTIPSGTIYDLDGVWSSSTGDTWAVGQLGTILHWNGSAFVSVTSPTTSDLRAIWGSSSSDLWAVGSYGAVLHYDGISWSFSPGVLSDHLYAVWGSGPGDGWAVSIAGTIEHWNGSAWAAVPSGTTNMLHGIWGSSATDVWAVGDAGTALHWDGNAWSAVATGSIDFFLDVWGSAANDVWAVGNGGNVIHFDGTAWSQVYLAPTGLTGVWGSSASDVWAVGAYGYMLHLSTNHVPPVTYTIGGTVSGAVVSGVSVTLSGAAGVRTFTGGTGAYSFFGLGDGSYTLTPSLAGYTFDPASLNVVVNGADVPLQDFVGIPVPTSFNVSGTVSGGVVGGVSVALLDALGATIASTFTDSFGNYSFTGIPAGSYTVSPSGPCYAFVPSTSPVVLDLTDAVVPDILEVMLTCFTWVNPLPQGNVLNAVWGRTPTDAWAVGGAGSVLHWDGASWSSVASGSMAFLNGIWASAANDAWAVGSELSSGQGAILHWDGAAWTTTSNGAALFLNGVWGSSATDVWAVGDAGTIVHWNGSGWSSLASGTTQDLRGVWGSSATDVWAVGGGSGNTPSTTTLHWDGSVWSEVANPLSGTTNQLNGLWGVTATDVWAVGFDNGNGTTRGSAALLHWDGTAWSSVVSPSLFWLTSVWGGSSGDFWAGGLQGLGHWDGTAWSLVGYSGRGVWGSAAGDLWAVGDLGVINHWDGAAWTLATAGGDYWNPRGIWGISATDVWAVGPGTFAKHWDGSTWTSVSTPVGFEAVWGTSPNDLWAVGGEIAHWDGSTWTTVTSPVSGTGTSLWAVGGSAANDIWAVGYPGAILHWDGTTWSTSTSPVSGTTVMLHGVWASAPNDAWVVGDGTTILHWDGVAWSSVPASPMYALLGVWGSSATDVWVVGRDQSLLSSILHWDGVTWSSIPTPRDIWLPQAIWGRSANDIWVAGGSTNFYFTSTSQLAHWDGHVWSSVPSGSVAILRGVWEDPAGGVWVVGDSGTILHR